MLFSSKNSSVYGSLWSSHDKLLIGYCFYFEDDILKIDNYMDLKFYLEELFDRKVDIAIFDSIKPAMKPSIMRSVKYAKGA